MKQEPVWANLIHPRMLYKLLQVLS
jgi:hypothetical protein